MGKHMGIELTDAVKQHLRQTGTSIKLQAKILLQNCSDYLLLQRDEPGKENDRKWEFPGGPFSSDQQADFLDCVIEENEDAFLYARNACQQNLFRETRLTSIETRLRYAIGSFDRSANKPTFIVFGESNRRDVTLPLHASGTSAHRDYLWIPEQSFLQLHETPHTGRTGGGTDVTLSPSNVMHYDEFQRFLVQRR